MTTETNDPLAGVPAVDWSSCFDAWWEVYHESPSHVVGDLPATTLEHIQWERQQKAALRARVERLRAVVARVSEQTVRFGGLSVVQFAAISSNALEPGDLEEPSE